MALPKGRAFRCNLFEDLPSGEGQSSKRISTAIPNAKKAAKLQSS